LYCVWSVSQSCWGETFLNSPCIKSFNYLMNAKPLMYTWYARDTEPVVTRTTDFFGGYVHAFICLLNFCTHTFYCAHNVKYGFNLTIEKTISLWCNLTLQKSMFLLNYCNTSTCSR
jgi:hypothetical protein